MGLHFICPTEPPHFFVKSLFNQALMMDVCLLMCVWQGRLLWFTHSTIAQLLCRQNDSATFLPRDASVEQRKKMIRASEKWEETNIFRFSSAGGHKWSIKAAAVIKASSLSSWSVSSLDHTQQQSQFHVAHTWHFLAVKCHSSVFNWIDFLYYLIGQKITSNGCICFFLW